MDSELYPEFAARLGYSLDQMLHNPTVAFIVDPEVLNNEILSK